MNNIRTFTAVTLIFSLLVAGNLLSPAKPYSKSERRVLAQLPALRSGSFTRSFEAYAADQFPLRDGFRRLKAGFSRNILLQKDNHGYFRSEGHLSKLEYPKNEQKWEKSIETIRAIEEKYLAGTDCTLYFSMIPDKNRYLSGYPRLDYDALEEELADALPFCVHVGLSDHLSLNCYYRTDLHWRQEKLLPAAKALSSAMGADISEDFSEEVLDEPFFGAYAGQAAIRTSPDEIHYLTNGILDNCKVTSFDTGRPLPSKIYDMDKARRRDPYELFLGGGDALLTIENLAAENSRELVMFRDSFGSAIAPLLVPGYRKITLVDLRYLRADMLGSFLTFEDQDVLFLYSTLLLNSGLAAT